MPGEHEGDAGQTESASPDAPPTDATATDAAAPDLGATDALPPDAAGPAVVPIVWIEVGGKTIPHSSARAPLRGSIRIIEDHDGAFAVNAAFQPVDKAALLARPVSLTADISIEGRGNTSWALYPKKSYSIELQDAAGQGKGQPVLAMPSSSDWVLYACYDDKTCLRNMLVYDIGRQLGRYNVRSRFAEVFIDGKYNGLYNLTEKIKIDRHRIDLPVPAGNAAAGDLTGGYIFGTDNPLDGPKTYWNDSDGTAWMYHSPSWSKITPAQDVRSAFKEHV